MTALQRVNGTRYQHGNIASTIYVASGSSVDWTYEKGLAFGSNYLTHLVVINCHFQIANIFFSYAVELRDLGEYGISLLFTFHIYNLERCKNQFCFI